MHARIDFITPSIDVPNWSGSVSPCKLLLHKESPVILKKMAQVSSKVLHSSEFSVLSPHRGGGFVVSDGEYKS